jgi:putative ABC transport system permease protein
MSIMTLSVARRNMQEGKARTAFSIAGVAVATLLLCFVVALYRGWNEEIGAYIHDTPADAWVVGKGADSFFTPSLVFNTTVVDLQQTRGVRKVSTLLGRPMKIRSGNDGWDSYIIGYNTAGIGGPVHIKEGHGAPAIGEIVIDDVLARTSGLGVGDELQAGLRHLKVVGISEGGNLVLAQLSFVNIEEARILLGTVGYVNFALIEAEPGATASIVQSINSSVPGVEAFTAATFAGNSKEVLHRSILPILAVIVLMAVFVGTIVVGLTVYTAAIEKEREFGILKAIGVPAFGLLRVIFEQSMVCGALGFAFGVGLAFLASWLAQLVIPQVVTLFRWQDLALIAAAAVVMSLLAGLLPMQRILRVDTLTVFKA